MTIDIKAFHLACDPSRTLDITVPEDKKVYIDFSPVRGEQVIEGIGDNIAEWSPDQPSCQLFTGHIGCGKSTELLRLKSLLEAKGFQVVYFDSSRYVNIGDVDVSDILISIIRQISEDGDLEKMIPEPPVKGYFQTIADGIKKILPEDTSVTLPGLETVGVPIRMLKTFAEWLKKAKESPDFRSRLRDYLEPKTDKILDGMNEELLDPVVARLKKEGKNGLVVIADGLDKIERSRSPGEKTRAEYLFSDRAEELKRLNCHLIYAIPFELVFSQEIGHISNRFGADPHVLPMIPVLQRDGNEEERGMELLRQMVTVRAFPDESGKQAKNRLSEIFEEEEILNQLCRVSGGHPRNLMRLVRECIRKKKSLPLSADALEDVIRENKNKASLPLSGVEWELLREVKASKNIQEYEKYHSLLRNHFVLEYRDKDGSWFDVNPILTGARELNV